MPMRKITFERRGCDFRPGTVEAKKSDIGNYRIDTLGYSVHGKDGNDYFIECCNWERYTYREVSKYGNKPLKHPKRELVNDCALSLKTQYEDGKHCWGNLEIDQEIRDMYLSYTREDVLKAINHIAAEPFDEIEII